MEAIPNSKIENNIRIKLIGLGNIINDENIIKIGGIAAEICTLEHFWSAILDNNRILDCSYEINIAYELLNVPKIKMNVLLEKLLDWQLYSNFIELYNVRAAILDFSRHIEFQN